MKKGKQTESLLQSLKNLKKQYISVGHFAEQGQHYSGMSYPDLMNLWARGGPDLKNPRVKAPRELLRTTIQALKDNPNLEIAFKEWIAQADKADTSEKLLDSFGKYLSDYYRDIFGKVGPFMAPDRNGTPLLETGDLKSKVGYKTSKNRSIRK